MPNEDIVLKKMQMETKNENKKLIESYKRLNIKCDMILEKIIYGSLIIID